MPIIKISPGFVNSVHAPGDYRDSELRGFCLRISKTGTKSYFVHGRIKGSKKLVLRTIGKHNDPWTTTKAREKAAEYLRFMRSGTDPNSILEGLAEQDRIQRLDKNTKKRAQELTLRFVFDAWASQARKTRDSTKTLYRWVIFKHLTDWLDMPMLQITPAMVNKRYSEIASSTISSANNCFRALRRIFNWMIEEFREELWPKETPNNPVSVLKKRDAWERLPSRQDVIAEDDLSSWFKSISKLPIDFKDYFVLLLVTGLRRDEAASLRWQDIDFKQRLFTVAVTKNGRPHSLPMTDFTFALLKRRFDTRQSKTYVFPGSGNSGHLQDARLYQLRVTSESKVVFTPHTLRRTFTTSAGLLLPEYVVKKLTNHIDGKDVTQSAYMVITAEKLRDPLNQVEAYLLKSADRQRLLTAPNKKAKVVPIRA